MVNTVLKFAAFCRVSDLRVSTSEILDCLSHLRLVNAIDESQFRAVLNANFVKSRRDQSNFDHLYALYFHDLRPDTETSDENFIISPQVQVLESLKNDDIDNSLSQALINFLSGDPLSYLEEIMRLRTSGEKISTSGIN